MPDVNCIAAIERGDLKEAKRIADFYYSRLTSKAVLTPEFRAKARATVNAYRKAAGIKEGV